MQQQQQQQQQQQTNFIATADLHKDLGQSAAVGKLYDKSTDKKRFSVQYPPSQLTYELIVETFGFIPLQFIDDIINAANDSVYRVTKALTEYVEAEQGAGLETDQAINRVETLLEYAIDKHFDKFELYALRNIFNIPKGLEHYIKMPYRNNSSVVVSKQDQDNLMKQLEANFKILLDQKMVGKKLDSNLHTLEKQISELESLESSLKDIFSGRSDSTDPDTPTLPPDELLAKMGALEPEFQKISQISSNIEANITDPEVIQLLNKPTAVDSFLNYSINSKQ